MVWCYACDDEVSGADHVRALLLEVAQDAKPKRNTRRPPVVAKPHSGIVKGTRGVSNIGNTCFLAAALQVLSHSVVFPKLLRHCPPYSLHELQAPSAQQKLVVALRKYFISQWTDPHDPRANVGTGAISPDDILTCVQRLNAMFHGYQQHDSQEFLRYVLTTVHEELTAATGDSPVATAFQGKTCSTVTCLKCKKGSKCVETFFDLSLSIPAEPLVVEPVKPVASTSSWLWTRARTLLGFVPESKVSIIDCLTNFFKQETLTGTDAYLCEHCTTKQDCLKQMSVEAWPETLVVHLKRFRHDWTSSKISKSVTFPVNSDLDLPNAPKYRLCGFVQHMGSISSGHYIAYAKHKSTGQWFCFDDSRVSLVTNMAVLEDAEPYVLFFQRVADPATVKERKRLKQAKLSVGVNPVLIPRKWAAETQCMSRISKMEAKSILCPHKRPSTTCPEFAKTLFVPVDAAYAQQAIKQFAEAPVSPESLETCSECQVFVQTYNHRLASQHKIVTKLDTKAIPETERWYFIDAAWVNAWRAYLRHGAIADSNRAVHPGAVDTEKLAERIKKDPSVLKLTTDFVAVNERVFTLFTHCHGFKGPLITNSSLDILGATVHADEEFNGELKPEFGVTDEEWQKLRHNACDSKIGHSQDS